MKSKTKLVYGVGINDADYVTNPKIMVGDKWISLPQCPYYKRWVGALQRCYSKKRQEKQPTYKGCTVCDEWLTFSNFKKWMETQKWEGRALDKDFLVEGNKVYSPSTCVFIPQALNNFILSNTIKRRKYPFGVSYRNKNHVMRNKHKKCFIARCHNQTGESLFLGYYYTQEDAHKAFLKNKLQLCKSYIEEFKEEPLILKGLSRIKDKIQYHIDNNLELTSF